jgi:hypothetical protein
VRGLVPRRPPPGDGQPRQAVSARCRRSAAIGRCPMLTRQRGWQPGHLPVRLPELQCGRECTLGDAGTLGLTPARCAGCAW